MTVQAGVTEATCRYCDSTAPLPDEIHASRVLAKQGQDEELEALERWWRSAREEYMELGADGVKRPPSNYSARGQALLYWGAALSFGSIIVS